MITIKSIGHEAGIFLTNAHHFLMGTEAALAKIAGNKTLQATVETVSALAFGPAVADIERAVFAVAGQFKVLLDDVNSTDHITKLTDMGFDKQVIADYQAVLAGLKNVAIPAHTGA